MKRYYR